MVPHAPVLIPQVAGDHRAAGEPTLDALRKLSLGDVDLLVICSPHGPRTGVYRHTSGDLGGFGLPHLSAGSPSASGAADRVARAWAVDPIDGAVDHGIVVPHLLLDLQALVVACAFVDEAGSSTGGVNGVRAAGRALGHALRSLSAELTLACVCSLHSSAALTPRAPLAQREEGIRFDEQLLVALSSDPSELEEVPDEAFVEAGSCAAGPLATLVELLGSSPMEVLGYDAPFGVGYLVAEAVGR